MSIFVIPRACPTVILERLVNMKPSKKEIEKFQAKEQKKLIGREVNRQESKEAFDRMMNKQAIQEVFRRLAVR